MMNEINQWPNGPLTIAQYDKMIVDAYQYNQAETIFQLAIIFSQGYKGVVDRDVGKAVRFYQWAARLEHEGALVALMDIYEFGNLGEPPRPKHFRRYQEQFERLVAARESRKRNRSVFGKVNVITI